jgi:hypothetical protein
VRELAEYGELSDLGAFLGSAENSQISRETFLPFAIVQRTVMGITNELNMTKRCPLYQRQPASGPEFGFS